MKAGELLLAVTANFTGTARELVSLFEQNTGHQLKTSFGSTGKLYSQIDNGAPFEIFLAADRAHPLKAEAAGLAVSGTRFTYARGKLVMWSANSSLFKNGESWLRNGEFTRIAMANPKTAPYGLAAKQTLQHLEMWQQIQPKLVTGDSVAQTFQFTATVNAESGFVAQSQVQAWHHKGSVWQIPESYYDPIEQQAILLTKGQGNPTAKSFLEFLKTNPARQIIRRHGYDVD